MTYLPGCTTPCRSVVGNLQPLTGFCAAREPFLNARIPVRPTKSSVCDE